MERMSVELEVQAISALIVECKFLGKILDYACKYFLILGERDKKSGLCNDTVASSDPVNLTFLY